MKVIKCAENSDNDNEPKRVALVTGGARGIGLEVARQLAKLGVTPVITSRDAARAKAAATLLKQEGLNALPHRLDVTNEASVEALRDFLVHVYGRLDILINNTGIAQLQSKCRASRTPLAVVRETFAVNVFGAIAVTNAVLSLLLRSRAGRIVNVSSIMGSMRLARDPTFGFGRQPEDLMMAYSASKSALTAATIQYATELRFTSVKVNAVCPGFTATEMTGYLGRPVSDAARVIVKMALLPSEGPTGAYLNDEGLIPW